MADGQYAEACPKFAESQRLDPAPARSSTSPSATEEQPARERLGHVQRAAADADRSGRPEWVKRGKEKAAALASDAHHAHGDRLEERASIDGPGSRATASRSAPRVGLKVPVDGGDHVIGGACPGHETWTTHVKAPAKSAALTVTWPS